MNEMLATNGAITDCFHDVNSGAKRAIIPSGQVIFRPDDAAQDFYLIESGEIRVYEIAHNGLRRLLEILGPNEWFGGATLAKLSLHGKLAISTVESVILSISVERFREMLNSHHDVAMSFLDEVGRHLYKAQTENAMFVFHDCRMRLIETLLKFKDSPAAKPVPGGIELRITHAELAGAIGAARETVSLCLIQLRNENLVHTSRNRVIFDPVRLRELGTSMQSSQALQVGDLSLQPQLGN